MSDFGTAGKRVVSDTVAGMYSHKATMLSLVALFSACGLVEEEQESIGNLTEAVTSTPLASDCHVCNNDCVSGSCAGGEYQVFGTSEQCCPVNKKQCFKAEYNLKCESALHDEVQLNAGEAAILFLQSRVASNDEELNHNSLRIFCNKAGGGYDEIHTTQNHPGTPAEQVVSTRMLLLGPTSYSCDVGALVGVGERGHYLIFKAGEDNTRLRRTDTLTAGWRWGTEYEESVGTLQAFSDECISGQCRKTKDADGQFKQCASENDCTAEYLPGIYIGPYDSRSIPSGEKIPTAGYVLHHPSRFEVPSSAPRLDVYSEVQLTGCPVGSVSCPTYLEDDGPNVGTTVGLRLVVQQMCNPTSSRVARTTYFPADGELIFPITKEEHHKKAHLVAQDVTFSTNSKNCFGFPAGAVTGRSMKVKTLVRWLDGANVKVEHGKNGRQGYSTSFAVVDYP